MAELKRRLSEIGYRPVMEAVHRGSVPLANGGVVADTAVATVVPALI